MIDFGAELARREAIALDHLARSPLIRVLDAVPGNAEISRRFAASQPNDDLPRDDPENDAKRDNHVP